jgi:hypothetical protein
VFLTQETKLKIGKRKPEDYFDEVGPGTLERSPPSGSRKIARSGE